MIHTLALKFNEGGPFMWVILGVLAVAVAVFLERIIFYFIICRVNGAKLVSDFARALNGNDTEKARKMAARKRAPVAVLLRTAVDRYSAGVNINEIQEAVEESAIHQVPRMTQRLNYLSLFANAGTLMGLLGTIAGLQSLFASLATVEAAKKAALLASGISEAMNTTAFGLLVAIPCMFAYTFLYNTQSKITRDLDESVARFLNYLRNKIAA